MTAPSPVARHRSEAKRFPARALSAGPSCSWWAPSTLMPGQAAVRRAGQVVEVWATQIDTIGGSSDTEVNELAIALAMWNARCG
jgi:hypothetical protein